jgi:hypothetical protein
MVFYFLIKLKGKLPTFPDFWCEEIAEIPLKLDLT